MAGKYAVLAKNYPKREARFGDYQTDRAYPELVEKHKAAITDRTPTALAALYIAFRRERAKLEDQLKAINARGVAVEQLMHSACEETAVESMTVDGCGVSVTDDISVSVENRIAYYAWAKKRKLGNLFTIPAATTESLTKERLLAGEDAPPGVKITSYKKTRATGLKAGNEES